MSPRKPMARALSCVLMSTLAIGSVRAQSAPAAPSAAPTAAPSTAPAATPTAAPSAAPAATPSAAPAATPSAAPAATPAAAPAAEQPPAVPAAPAAEPAAAPASPAPADPAALREAERARLRLLLARARAERAALDPKGGATFNAQPVYAAQVAPQREAPAVHGDAGAALALAVSIELPFHSDDGYALVSDEEVAPRLGVWATYDVLALSDDAFLAAGLGFEVESAQNGSAYGEVPQGELTAIVPYATAVLRYVPFAVVQPHVRLSGGAQFTDVELQVGPGEYADQDTLPFASLGAGITLRSPTRLFETRRGRFSSLSLGLMLEGGYALIAPLGVTLDGGGPERGDIQLIESELGEITRSGPFFRTSVVARF